VTFAVTLRFIYEINLYIADIRATAQVILTYQPIEIDRRCGACIDLIITHFRHRGDLSGQRHQHPVCLFQRSAFGHIDDHLELRLIVKRQHFKDHQFETDQADRKNDKYQHGRQHQVTRIAALCLSQERCKQPSEQGQQAAASIVMRCLSYRVRTAQ